MTFTLWEERRRNSCEQTVRRRGSCWRFTLLKPESHPLLPTDTHVDSHESHHLKYRERASRLQLLKREEIKLTSQTIKTYHLFSFRQMRIQEQAEINKQNTTEIIESHHSRDCGGGTERVAFTEEWNPETGSNGLLLFLILNNWNPTGVESGGEQKSVLAWLERWWCDANLGFFFCIPPL